MFAHSKAHNNFEKQLRILIGGFKDFFIFTPYPWGKLNHQLESHGVYFSHRILQVEIQRKRQTWIFEEQ